MTALKNAVVLITGAASGIGHLMALEAASRGARLALLDRDAGGLERVRAEVEGLGQVAKTFPCDLRDRLAIQASLAEVEAAFGSLDVLINNAGVVGGKPLLEAADESIELTFQVNALAPIWTTRAALPGMIARSRGHIVTIASAGGLVGTTRLVDYCASKFAAVGFDDALRAELRRLGLSVRTTVVCPFYIHTGMFEGVKTRLPWLLPILRPEDVAARVIRAIERDQPRLLMPWAVHLVNPLRLLPVAWFDALMSWLGVKTRLPWLLPILRPEDVAARVIRAIEWDQPRLLMPWAVHLVNPLRLLPVAWFDTLMRWLGVSASMDDFRGR